MWHEKRTGFAHARSNAAPRGMMGMTIQVAPNEAGREENSQTIKLE